jgi:apolipoprotein N-acyltransferase
VVQAAPTGYSALIGAGGRVVARSVLGREEVLIGRVERRTGQTVYVRFGGLPVGVLALVALAGPWLAIRRRAGTVAG